MIDELINLLLLGDLENEIESLSGSIVRTPVKIDELNTAIATVRKDFERLKQRDAEVKKTYKLKEVDVKAIDEHMNKLNGQLFTVKTNEEYRAMLKEIEVLKEKKKKIEDEIILLMEEEEENRARLKQSENEMQTRISQHQEEIKVLDGKLIFFKEQLEEKTEAHKKARESLPAKVIKEYERIKKSRKTGVARVENTICEGCYATLSHQVLNELKRGDKVMYCDYCGRILIWDRKAAKD